MVVVWLKGLLVILPSYPSRQVGAYATPRGTPRAMALSKLSGDSGRMTSEPFNQTTTILSKLPNPQNY